MIKLNYMNKPLIFHSTHQFPFSFLQIQFYCFSILHPVISPCSVIESPWLTAPGSVLAALELYQLHPLSIQNLKVLG